MVYYSQTAKTMSASHVIAAC